MTYKKSESLTAIASLQYNSTSIRSESPGPNVILLGFTLKKLSFNLVNNLIRVVVIEVLVAVKCFIVFDKH